MNIKYIPDNYRHFLPLHSSTCNIWPVAVIASLQQWTVLPIEQNILSLMTKKKSKTVVLHLPL